MNEIFRRRRALMAQGESAPQIVDTSCTAMGEYPVTKVNAKKSLTGARSAALFRVYYSTASSGNYSTSNYFAIQTSATTKEIPTTNVLRIKVGNSSAATESNPVSIDMKTAYLYWTATGNIIFAGSETQYYGMSNINGTMAQPGWTPAKS